MNCAFCYFDRPPDGVTKTAWFVIAGHSTCEAHVPVAKEGHWPGADTLKSVWTEKD